MNKGRNFLVGVDDTEVVIDNSSVPSPANKLMVAPSEPQTVVAGKHDRPIALASQCQYRSYLPNSEGTGGALLEQFIAIGDGATDRSNLP